MYVKTKGVESLFFLSVKISSVSLDILLSTLETNFPNICIYKCHLNLEPKEHKKNWQI